LATSAERTFITSSRRATRVALSAKAPPHASTPSARQSGAQCWSLAVMCAYFPSLERKVAEGTRPGCSVPSLGGTSLSAK
jgi:hypothetical protein